MGMFDLLRSKLKKFGKDVEEEVAKELPAEPAQPAQPAPTAPRPEPGGGRGAEPLPGRGAEPKAKPAKPAPEDEEGPFDEELEAELAKIEAEVEAGKAAPAKPASLPRREEPRRAPAAPALPLEAPPPAPAPTPPLRSPAARAPAAARPAPAAPAPARRATGGGIRPERVEELLWDLELMLLEADIAVPVAETIKEKLKESLPNLRVGSTAEVQPAVEQALKDALRDVLSSQVMDFDEFILNAKKPVKIMFVGINGTGKTTTIARVAHRLKQNGYSSVLAAGDTFRAGAIEQIGLHSDRLGLTVVKHAAGADPAAVAHDAIQHALSRRKDVVLIDTAGRMQTNVNLMAEMQKIKRVAKPDLIVFVGDALAGNDAVEQARKFDETVGIDAAVLTKVDTDSKGGAALSIAHAVGKPILFLGVGQAYEDLIPFDPDWVIAHIFGE